MRSIDSIHPLLKKLPRIRKDHALQRDRRIAMESIVATSQLLLHSAEMLIQQFDTIQLPAKETNNSLNSGPTSETVNETPKKGILTFNQSSEENQSAF